MKRNFCDSTSPSSEGTVPKLILRCLSCKTVPSAYPDATF